MVYRGIYVGLGAVVLKENLARWCQTHCDSLSKVTGCIMEVGEPMRK